METALRHAAGQINLFFNNAGLRRLWIRLRAVVAVVAVCLLIPFVRLEWFWIGFSVSLAGELIQLWCFASLKKKKSLACEGPYAAVRNPMYLGRYFILLGVVLLLGLPGIYAIVPFSIVYGFYMVNRVKREEKTLAGIFGEDYVDYCRNVNRFLPTLHGVRLRTLLFWKWDLLIENHGLSNAVGLLAAYAALYLGAFLFPK